MHLSEHFILCKTQLLAVIHIRVTFHMVLWCGSYSYLQEAYRVYVTNELILMWYTSNMVKNLTNLREYCLMHVLRNDGILDVKPELASSSLSRSTHLNEEEIVTVATPTDTVQLKKKSFNKGLQF